MSQWRFLPGHTFLFFWLCKRILVKYLSLFFDNLTQIRIFNIIILNSRYLLKNITIIEVLYQLSSKKIKE